MGSQAMPGLGQRQAMGTGQRAELLRSPIASSCCLLLRWQGPLPRPGRRWLLADEVGKEVRCHPQVTVLMGDGFLAGDPLLEGLIFYGAVIARSQAGIHQPQLDEGHWVGLLDLAPLQLVERRIGHGREIGGLAPAQGDVMAPAAPLQPQGQGAPKGQPGLLGWVQGMDRIGHCSPMGNAN